MEDEQVNFAQAEGDRVDRLGTSKKLVSVIKKKSNKSIDTWFEDGS